MVSGDAFKQIPNVEGQFDFVFLDAWKRDYQKFFDMVFPRMPKGALFVAHNVLNKKSEMPDFLQHDRDPAGSVLDHRRPLGRGGLGVLETAVATGTR